MKDYNHVSVIGRLTRDAELRYTNEGKALCKFSVAVNGYKDDEVSFLVCVMFGQRAEKLSQYLTKGKQVCLGGELKQNRWEKDGTKRERVEIIVNDLQLLGKSEGKPVDTGFDDDIPF